MKMKKILSVVLAAVLALGVVFAFAGCSGKGGNEESSASSSEAASSASFTTIESGKLIMATNATFPPYESVDGNGNVIGIDAEIAKVISDDLGLELQIENVEFDSIIAGVQTNKYDIGMAGITVTDERKQLVNFSDSYATGIQVVIVNDGSSIKSVDDIKKDGSTKIGVQMGTTGDIHASEDYGSENVVEYKTGADAVQGLIAGKVQCVIIDNEPAKAFVEANEGLHILDTEYVSENYAICFNKSNTALLNAVNEVIAKRKADGTIQSILDKYISSEAESSTAA